MPDVQQVEAAIRKNQATALLVHLVAYGGKGSGIEDLWRRHSGKVQHLGPAPARVASGLRTIRRPIYFLSRMSAARTSKRQYWMVKQEPTAYSWTQFVADGETAWTGVRNFMARNNLRTMRTGDRVLFYHSVVGKEVVGIAEVKRDAYPDPTAEEGDWSCVDLAPVEPLKKPVTLAQIKQTPELATVPLLKYSRLSVMSLTAEEFAAIVELAK